MQRMEMQVRIVLIAILLGFPLLEAVVLVRLSDTLGWWVLAWVVLAACAGMALIKASAAVYPQLEAAIRERHPYEVPEIISWPVTRGLPEYLAWVESESIAP